MFIIPSFLFDGERRPKNRRKAHRLNIEPLEDRTLLSFANILVNNPAEDTTTRDTQSETSMVLGASGNVLVVYNDSGSAVGNTKNSVGFSTSANGGGSFTDRGALPNSAAGIRADTSLARDTSSGITYLSALTFTPNVVQVWRSSNDGVSFGPPVSATPGLSSASSIDKPWITVDNSTATGSGRGNVYVVYENINGTGHDIDLNYSTNGGATWSLPVLVAHNGGGAYITVGPDHAVYVFYYTWGTQGHILMAKSTNQGLTFGAAVTVATLSGRGPDGDLGLTVSNTSTAAIRTNTFPQAAVTSSGIFVAYDDVGTTRTDRADVFLSYSMNAGTTWTRLRVNDDATTRDQWQPALAVTPSGSALAIFWYDRRQDPNNGMIDRYGAIATISGSTLTWRANVRITDTSFPAVVNQDPGEKSDYMGDYDVAVADTHNFYTAWGDNRQADAYFAHQPDVRFAVVSLRPILSSAEPNIIASPDHELIASLATSITDSAAANFMIVISQPPRRSRRANALTKAACSADLSPRVSPASSAGTFSQSPENISEGMIPFDGAERI
jgi:hypothetical protein